MVTGLLVTKSFAFLSPHTVHSPASFSHHFILNPLILISLQHLFYVCSRSFQFNSFFFCSIVGCSCPAYPIAYEHCCVIQKRIFKSFTLSSICIFKHWFHLRRTARCTPSLFNPSVAVSVRCLPLLSGFAFVLFCCGCCSMLRFVFKISAITEQKQTDQGFILIM